MTELKTFTDMELETLLARRERIEQAKGMLMLLYGVDGEAAFRMLKEISQARNVKLVEVAVGIVAALTEDGLDVERCRRHAGERLFQRHFVPGYDSQPPAGPRYRLERERHRSVRLVVASGALDLAAVEELHEALTWALLPARRIVVDLVNVDELDAIAATMIANFERRVRREKQFAVAADAGPVLETLRAVADSSLAVYPTGMEAMWTSSAEAGATARSASARDEPLRATRRSS